MIWTIHRTVGENIKQQRNRSMRFLQCTQITPKKESPSTTITRRTLLQLKYWQFGMSNTWGHYMHPPRINHLRLIDILCLLAKYACNQSITPKVAHRIQHWRMQDSRNACSENICDKSITLKVPSENKKISKFFVTPKLCITTQSLAYN